MKRPIQIIATLGVVLVNAVGADFAVTNTNNLGAGSLRQALLDANTNAGLDRIVFSIPGDSLHVIRVTNVLPELTDAVVIDGYTQPGSNPNSLPDADNAALRIQVHGGDLSFDGLALRGDGTTIRGLVISGFFRGIFVHSSSNRILGNFIGTDASGITAASNRVGIFLNGVCCNVVGGTNPGDRNIIAGNNNTSLRVGTLSDAVLRDSVILGNFIGVDASGSKSLIGYGSSSGISVEIAENLVVGGLEEGARNVIASGHFGVRLYGGVTDISILGNYIGVSADGKTETFGWLGIGYPPESFVTDWPRRVLIKGNSLAYHNTAILLGSYFGDPSVGGTEFTISQNSIFSNQFSGIDFDGLGRVNDAGDGDSGINGLQNYPELQSVRFETNTFISGVLSSQPNKSYTIEFFASSAVPADGFGEGEIYLGTITVSTPASGIVSFEVEFPVRPFHPFITATATDPDGNTSIFSRPVKGRSPTTPLFHLHPVGLVTLPGSNVLFRADVTGKEPLLIQWRRNGIDIQNATNLTLLLTNVQWESRGTYTLLASNSFGVVESLPAELVVVPGPTILVQPTNAFVFPGATVTIQVDAGGTLPLFYQWRRNGSDILHATNETLVLTNVHWTDRGNYSVVISNAFDVVESIAATLLVRVRPDIIQQPLSQAVVTGGTVTLSVSITNAATVPITYIWRSNNFPVFVSTEQGHVGYYTVTNVTTNVEYRVLVTNYFGPPGTISARAMLTVLADADHDGLPDAFEDAYDFDRDDPSDAGLDADNDQRTNAEEFVAGTDPHDPLDRLKVDSVEANNDQVVLEFSAVSNRTYSVQFQDALDSGGWLTLTNIPARSTNGVERVTDTRSVLKRFYRLVTPKG